MTFRSPLKPTPSQPMISNNSASDDNLQFFFFSHIRFPDLNYSKKLPLSELPLSKDKYWSIVAYNQSKLCNLLFSMELNRRLKPKGVTCNAVHPGNLIYTSLSKNSWFYWLFFIMARPFSKTSVRQTFNTNQELNF